MDQSLPEQGLAAADQAALEDAATEEYEMDQDMEDLDDCNDIEDLDAAYNSCVSASHAPAGAAGMPQLSAAGAAEQAAAVVECAAASLPASVLGAAAIAATAGEGSATTAGAVVAAADAAATAAAGIAASAPAAVVPQVAAAPVAAAVITVGAAEASSAPAASQPKPYSKPLISAAERQHGYIESVDKATRTVVIRWQMRDEILMQFPGQARPLVRASFVEVGVSTGVAGGSTFRAEHRFDEGNAQVSFLINANVPQPPSHLLPRVIVLPEGLVAMSVRNQVGQLIPVRSSGRIQNWNPMHDKFPGHIRAFGAEGAYDVFFGASNMEDADGNPCAADSVPYLDQLVTFLARANRGRIRVVAQQVRGIDGPLRLRLTPAQYQAAAHAAHAAKVVAEQAYYAADTLATEALAALHAAQRQRTTVRQTTVQQPNHAELTAAADAVLRAAIAHSRATEEDKQRKLSAKWLANHAYNEAANVVDDADYP